MAPNDWDYKKTLTERVKRNIAEKDGEQLLVALDAAEAHLSENRELLFEALYFASDYQLSKGEPFESIRLLNKSRKYNPSIVQVFDKIIDTFTRIYDSNKEKFTKGDLKTIMPAIQMLIDYYAKFDLSEKSRKAGDDLLGRMVYRYKYVAEEQVEGKLTFQINNLAATIEKDVPIEQVKEEVAKIIANLLRRRISRKGRGEGNE